MLKWLTSFSTAAAFALFATTPAALADEMSTYEQETVVPQEDEGLIGEEAEADVEADVEVEETVIPAEEDDALYGEDEVQEEAVPAPQGSVRTENQIIVTQPRAGAQPLDNVIVEAGGGFSSYSGTLGDALEGGAGWSARAVLGARSPLGVELGYFGAANTIENAGIEGVDEIDLDNTVVASNGEALARWNMAGARSPVKPFLAGGVGYLRFDSNAAFDNDQALAFPLAAGVQFYPADNFTIGARGEYRILTDLIDEDMTNGNQWGGVVSVGANF